MVQDVGSSKCLAVAGGSFDNNAVLVQYNCDGNATRKWNFFLTANGTQALIANGATGKCVTPGGQGANTEHWHMVQYNCDSDPHRYWQIRSTRNSGTQAQWRNVGSGYCLAIDGNSTATTRSSSS
jgi:internalin A